MKTLQKNAIALLVIFFAISALYVTHRTVAPKESSWEDVTQEALAGNYNLITTEELGAWFSETGDLPLMVDTRQEWEYRAGHIQGAVNFPMEPTWLSRWQKRSALEQFLGSDKDKTIVFY